jgi:hypothetical protein
MTINIWGKYKGAVPEIIDTATSLRDAEYLIREYRMAYGKDWLIWQGRRKDRPDVKAPGLPPSDWL